MDKYVANEAGFIAEVIELDAMVKINTSSVKVVTDDMLKIANDAIVKGLADYVRDLYKGKAGDVAKSVEKADDATLAHNAIRAMSGWGTRDAIEVKGLNLNANTVSQYNNTIGAREKMLCALTVKDGKVACKRWDKLIIRAKGDK
jgi:hypothetical protein